MCCVVLCVQCMCVVCGMLCVYMCMSCMYCEVQCFRDYPDLDYPDNLEIPGPTPKGVARAG